jgi:hypothetical protein
MRTIQKVICTLALLCAAAWAQQTNQNNYPGQGGGGGGNIGNGGTNLLSGHLVFATGISTIGTGEIVGPDATTSGNNITVTGASGNFTAIGNVSGAQYSTPSGLMLWTGSNAAHTQCPITNTGSTAVCAVNDAAIGTGDALSVSIDGNLYNPIMYSAGANTIGSLVMGTITPPPVTNLTFSSSSGSLVAGTYNYGVSATNGTGSGNNLGESTLGTEQQTTTGSTGQITVTWTPQVGATGYCIYRGPNGSELQLACVSGGNSSNYTDTGVLSPTASITAWSITSNVATFTATNTFVAGQTVILSGFGTSTFFNSQPVAVIATGLSGSQFEANFTHTNGSATESGTGTALSPQTVNRSDNLIFDRLQSSSASAPNYGGSILLGQSDPIIAGTSSSSVTTTCGSTAQKCITMLRQQNGQTVLGDNQGVEVGLLTSGNGGFFQFREIAAPAVPPASEEIVYADSTSHTVSCINHTGGSCFAGGGGGVTSFTGDGTLLNNSASTGAVTATLANAGAHKWWGNNTGVSAAPAYLSLTNSDLPAITFDSTATGLAAPSGNGTFTFPSGNQLSLSGTQPGVQAGTGTAGTSPFTYTATTGGNTSGSATTAGAGASTTETCGGTGGTSSGGTNVVGGAGGACNFTAGSGGASTGTGANSNGGSVFFNTGALGTGGSGTAGKVGTFVITTGGTQSSPATAGDLFEVLASNGAARLIVDSNNNLQTTAGSNFETTTTTGAMTICGGQCSTSTAAAGTGFVQMSGTNTSNSTSTAVAGGTFVTGGILTAATPNASALEGVMQVGEGYLKGSAVAALGDVVCGTTTAFTVTDCSHTGPQVNIIGIATSTSNPIVVVTDGQALVKTDGAVTLGDTLCMGTTTDGQAHDSGGQASCGTAGTSIGIVVAVSGTIRTLTGATNGTTAMSTTLPLVQLHIGK